MKNLVFIMILTASVSIAQSIDKIGTGTSFGECLGYCLSDLQIYSDQTYYRLYGWDTSDSVYLPVDIQDNTDEIFWQSLIDSLDIDLFMSLDSVIGCPDCNDGGSEWFEITIDDMVKRVMIEYGSSIEGLDGFITLLRSLRDSFQEVQSCYFVPNSGICDGVFPRYYFDQEENQCAEFIWGGCEGLVPFGTMEECELNCSNQDSTYITGYLRTTEISFCMDDCSMYYIEDEVGNFISNISNQNNIEFFEYYLNRFVQVEGELIECVECEALNITSIRLSPDCQFPVFCLDDPCSVGNCISDSTAGCVANYCGGCYADYFNVPDGELIYCEPPPGLVDLTGIYFGDCEMALGVGWVNNSCQEISGCGWVVDSADYSDAFFSTVQECIEASTLDIDYAIPRKFYLEQNYPNPFNSITKLGYVLPKDSFVNITVYDMLGNIIKTLVYNLKDAGSHSTIWDGTNNQGVSVSAGIYIYRIQAVGFTQTKKMILLN